MNVVQDALILVGQAHSERLSEQTCLNRLGDVEAYSLVGVEREVLSCDCAVTVIDAAHVLPRADLIWVDTLVDEDRLRFCTEPERGTFELPIFVDIDAHRLVNRSTLFEAHREQVVWLRQVCSRVFR